MAPGHIPGSGVAQSQIKLNGISTSSQKIPELSLTGLNPARPSNRDYRKKWLTTGRAKKVACFGP